MLDPEVDVREPWQKAWVEIEQWCKAAEVVHHLRNSRVGFLGHAYPGMLGFSMDMGRTRSIG